MFQYLLYTLLFQLVFLLVYELLLKQQTFFSYNRYYLLLTPIISLILPFISVESLVQAVPVQTVVTLPEVILGGTNKVLETARMELTSNGFALYFWPFIYSLGIMISFLWFIRKYMVLKALFNNRIISRIAGVNIIEVPDSQVACTFFRTIFLGDKISRGEREQIISHELIHVYQRHSWDLLFFEFLKILFWFNPFIYIFQTRISALHEYIADAGVVKTLEKRTYFQQLLNTAFQTENISFINQFFNSSLIKKRILMLQRTRSTSLAKLRYLVLLPVVFFMLTLVSFSQEQGNEDQKTVQDTTIKIEVKDVQNQTASEKKEIQEALEDLKDGKPYSKLIITDGVSKIVYEATKESGVVIISKIEELPNSSYVKSKDVPFELIEEVPIYPGCEDMQSIEDKKECMAQKIAAHVNTNFNLGLAKDLPLTGMQQIYVQFKIDDTGKVTAVRARAPAPELEREAIRVVEALPQMTPGQHKGKAVNVLYSLPIKFILNKDTEEQSSAED